MHSELVKSKRESEKRIQAMGEAVNAQKQKYGEIQQTRVRGEKA